MISNLLYLTLAAISKDDVNIPKAELNNAQFQSLFSTLLGVAGVVAVIFVILGGYKYAISQGNPTDLEKAKNIIVYALVGLGFVIMAFTIVQFVTANLF
jgi:TRAP-type C4-dicarboxylate transport system permease small subunit